MIKTVGDLLQALKQKEEQRMRSFLPIPHAPTIGSMYEGATKRLLDMAVFEGLGLRISSGFIKNSGNEISRQIDCMVTVGAGTAIPNTDDGVFEVSDVIAVVEVKKNLHGRELEDAMKLVARLSAKNHGATRESTNRLAERCLERHYRDRIAGTD